MNLPPLPILPALPKLPTLAAQAPLPFEPDYSPWFPMSRQPWESGYYQIKTINRGVEVTLEERMLYEVGSGWHITDTGSIEAAPLAWRGLAHPAS